MQKFLVIKNVIKYNDVKLGTMQMINGFNDPNYGDTLKTTLKSLSQTKQGTETVDNLFSNLNSQFNNTSYNDNYKSTNMLANMTNDPRYILLIVLL